MTSGRGAPGWASKKRRPSAAAVRSKAEAKRILGEPMSAYQVADVLCYPKTLPDDVLEKPFQDAVIKLAEHLGLLVYHTYRSDRSERGFPDLVIVGWGGIAFLELKKQTGVVAPDQEVWNFALARIAKLSFGLIHVGVYRPSDFLIDGPICQLLARLARPPKMLRLLTRVKAAGIDTSDLDIAA